MLSTDGRRDLYDARAAELFDRYGGAEWPSVILEGGFEGALPFGDFGYGVIVVDAEGIVRAINPSDIEAAVGAVFEQVGQPNATQ